MFPKNVPVFLRPPGRNFVEGFNPFGHDKIVLENLCVSLDMRCEDQNTEYGARKLSPENLCRMRSPAIPFKSPCEED